MQHDIGRWKGQMGEYTLKWKDIIWANSFLEWPHWQEKPQIFLPRATVKSIHFLKYYILSIFSEYIIVDYK